LGIGRHVKRFLLQASISKKDICITSPGVTLYVFDLDIGVEVTSETTYQTKRLFDDDKRSYLEIGGYVSKYCTN
jgi:hypothetical protein